ncbi:MAG: prealbumin-like fold domain-containing protein, partial [Coriobacteriales bacterium]
MMRWKNDGGGLGRAFAAYVALALTVAIVSPGIAVYADESQTPSGNIGGPEVVSPDVSAPSEVATRVVKQGTSPAAEIAGRALAQPRVTVSPRVKGRVTKAATTKVIGPSASPAAPAPSDPATPYAPVGSVSLDGWTRLPHAKWTSGDVKGYVEGEWIPFRLTIDNRGGSAVTVRVPSMAYKVDYINGGAIAIDETDGWRWQVGSGAVTAYTPSVQDDDTDPMYLETDLPEEPEFIIPAGQTGYIYFEGHLALTPYWIARTPSYLGASGYPGSSAQARLVEWGGIGIGDKTVPFPVGRETQPTGVFTGLKFFDFNGDGVYRDATGTPQPGEYPLAGWVFHLTYLDADYGFSLTATSAADGTFSFTGLPPGDYQLVEVPESPYQLTTDLSGSFAVLTGQTTGPIEVGNRPPDVTKTFELTVTGEAPAADGYFVRYTVSSVTTDLPLAGSGGVY